MDHVYDVVIATLEQKRDSLWEITSRNMHSEFSGMGIMDDIRLSQIAQLQKAIDLWKTDQQK
jgi:hypothetical protein